MKRKVSPRTSEDQQSPRSDTDSPIDFGEDWRAAGGVKVRAAKACVTAAPEKLPPRKALEAAREYLRRQARLSHPDGEFDNKRRFTPSSAERQPCCGHIRHPSAAFPYSLMVHCRTKQHIEHVYGVNHCDMLLALRVLNGSIDTADRLLGLKPPLPTALERVLEDDMRVEKMSRQPSRDGGRTSWDQVGQVNLDRDDAAE